MATIALCGWAMAADPANPSVGPDEALSRLKAGNARFAQSKVSTGLGSIEYAVDHLGTRLIVVLGHSRCGAVTAALAGGSAPGHINSLVRDIQPAVAAAKGKEGDALANAIHENDAQVAKKIRDHAQLGEFASQVRIIEAYYNLDTGKVEWTAE